MRRLLTSLLLAVSLSAGATNPALIADLNRTFGAYEGMPFLATGSRSVFIWNARPWGTDGSDAGTRLLADVLNVGTMSRGNGQAYFTAWDGQQNLIYRTDGSVAGTTVVAHAQAFDLHPTATGVYYSDVAQPGPNLHWADGTTVQDFTTDAYVGDLSRAASSGDTLFIPTSQGLYRVAPGSPVQLLHAGYSILCAVVGDTVVFWDYDAAQGLYQLWTSDGTAAGTKSSGVQFKFVTAGTVFQGALYFAAGDVFDDTVLMRTDGTAAGTVQVQAIHGAGIRPVVAGSYLYFPARASAADPVPQVWRSDGTVAGTLAVSNVANVPFDLTPVGSDLYFRFGDTNRTRLYRTSGTLASTVEITVQPGNGQPLGEVAGRLAIGTKIVWITDGTDAGTRILRAAMGEPSAGSVGGSRAVIGGNLLFSANDGEHGIELWRTDGTAAGTAIVKDLAPGEADGAPRGAMLTPSILDPRYTVLGSRALFIANSCSTDYPYCRTLWGSDGSTAGTVQLTSMTGDRFVKAGANALFLRFASGIEVWRTDGTPANTTQIATLTRMVDESTLRAVGNSAALFTIDTLGSFSLLCIDGDTGAVSNVRTIDGGPSGTPLSAGRFVYFLSSAPGTTTLWRSDCTSAGTIALRTSGSLKTGMLATWGDQLLFTESTDGITNTLWATDGSVAGIRQLSSANIYGILASVQVGPRLYFQDAEKRFWRTDGTAGGTSVVADFHGVDATMAELTAVGGTIYFTYTPFGGIPQVWMTSGAPGSTGPLGGSPFYATTFEALPNGLFMAANGGEPSLWTFDRDPDAFSFATAAPVRLASLVTSAPARITGIDADATVTATNGQVCVSTNVDCTCDVSTYAGSVTVSPSQSICVRHTSAATALASTTTTLSIGTTTATFTSTTGAPQPLQVARSGNGAGRVAGANGAIDCGTTCAASIPFGDPVTLVASPAPGSHFVGWTGGCTGRIACTVTMNGAAAVTATFAVGMASAGPDFDGDGRGDLLWQHPTQGTGEWLMSGTQPFAGTAFAGPTPTSRIVFANADFDGDGRSDILWRSSTGRYDISLMQGLGRVTTTIYDSGTDWQVVFTADLDGDGKADLIWRNTAGVYAAWLMNGATPVGGGSLTPPDSTAQLFKVADFDGDGKSDLLWLRADGGYDITLMNGVNPKSSQSILPGGTGWSVVGSGDFNGDGKADLLWKHTSGAFGLWLIDGTAVPPASIVTNGATWSGFPGGWNILGTADLDGDGKSDILWANTNGTVSAWLMNGIAPVAAKDLMGPSSGWSLVMTRDFNGDGKDDILWRHTSGQYAIWLMDGLTPTAGTTVLGGGSGWEAAP